MPLTRSLSQVEFIQGLRVLGQDGDPRFETHLVSKDEREVMREGKGGRTYKTRQKILTYALIITDVTLDDQGFYECHAGSDAHASLEVTIKRKNKTRLLIKLSHNTAHNNHTPTRRLTTFTKHRANGKFREIVGFLWSGGSKW